MKGLSKHALKIGVFAIVLYAVCLIWKAVLTDPAAQTFHLTALKVAFPGFKGYDGLSMLWGAAMSFIYGYLASVVWHSLHKNCCNGTSTNK